MKDASFTQQMNLIKSLSKEGKKFQESQDAILHTLLVMNTDPSSDQENANNFDNNVQSKVLKLLMKLDKNCKLQQNAIKSTRVLKRETSITKKASGVEMTSLIIVTHVEPVLIKVTNAQRKDTTTKLKQHLPKSWEVVLSVCTKLIG